jgi:hypothetical protein
MRVGAALHTTAPAETKWKSDFKRHFGKYSRCRENIFQTPKLKQGSALVDHFLIEMIQIHSRKLNSNHWLAMTWFGPLSPTIYGKDYRSHWTLQLLTKFSVITVMLTGASLSHARRTTGFLPSPRLRFQHVLRKNSNIVITIFYQESTI